MNDSDQPGGAWQRLSRVAISGAEYDSAERLPHPKCLPGTRVTLLEHSYGFLDDAEKSRIVWVHGTAGVGKSAFAFTVAERMRNLKTDEGKYNEKRLAGTFFFSRGNANRSTTGCFFGTLAYQLARNFPSVKDTLAKAICDDPALLQPTKSLREQMEALFLLPLRRLQLRLQDCPPLIFVVDALDECRSESEISLLMSLLGQALRDPGIPVTHILLTSRSEAHVSKAIRDEKVYPLVCEIPVKTSADDASLISLDGADVDSDIVLFLKHSFMDKQSTHSSFPQPTEQDLCRLAKRAGRRFIIASTMMKFIDDEYCDPYERLQLMLDLTCDLMPGTEVYELYNQILSTCTDPERAYLHLSVVATLVDPLPVSQISELLGPGQGRDTEKLLVQLRSIMDIPTDDALPVRIYHSSVRDYVLEFSTRSRFGGHDITLSPHSLLASSSLRLMMRVIPKSTGLKDALSTLCQQSGAMHPAPPKDLMQSLAFTVEPLTAVGVLSALIWLRGDGGPTLYSWLGEPNGRTWLQTSGGQRWLQTDSGREWLPTHGGQEWLQAHNGRKWLQTRRGRGWLETDSGRVWLETDSGRVWLQTDNGPEWLETHGGREWLETHGGREWLKGHGGLEWLQTDSGREWLQTHSVPEIHIGSEWLQTHDGREWLKSHNGLEWLQTDSGREWLQQTDTRQERLETDSELELLESDMLETDSGREWLVTKSGQEWLQTASAREWLQTLSAWKWLETVSARKWLGTKSGREWLQTDSAREWLQTDSMREWVQTGNAQEWLQTLSARTWLQTPGGRKWLQTHSAQEWLQTDDGREWLQTDDAILWLQTHSAREWLQTHIGLEWLRIHNGREWLQTDGGREWLETHGGKELLDIYSAQKWLQADSGRMWLQTGRGGKWLETDSGRRWLQTWHGEKWLVTSDSARKWLQTKSAQVWLQAYSAQEWLLGQSGTEWLLTNNGQEWLQTDSGREWLQTDSAQEWLKSDSGLEWLQTRRGQKWLLTDSGLKWLRTQDGERWLHTDSGLEWLQTDSGLEWLQTHRGFEVLQTRTVRIWLKTHGGLKWLQTHNAREWLQTDDGRRWLRTDDAKMWLQSHDGREWLKTSNGKAWMSTPAASFWVQMREFFDAVEAINNFFITPRLSSHPTSQIIQQFKSLPDFLMFPTFLALTSNHPTPATLPHCSAIEIIRVMSAFVTSTDEARKRSRSASGALIYACQNWISHLSQAPEPWDKTLHHKFNYFWEHHLSSWLETQWCLGGLQSCLTVLSQAQMFIMNKQDLTKD